MEAREKSLNFITKEKKIVIPFFQRSYVWKKDNWEELLTDLRKEKSHFLGSLIIKQHKRSGEVGEALVIDGQQRLTTLSILIKAIYDCFDDGLKNNTRDKVNNCLFYKVHDTDSDWQIKIIHSRVDREFYANVINGNCPPKRDDENKIYACYHYFVDEIKNMSTEDIKGLFNKILDDENKMLVVIDINANEDEQSIFDTINTAGVKLTAADSIKNNLFQRGFELFGNGSQKVETLYDEYWGKSFLADEETIEFWSQERATGRVMRQNIDIFLQAYAVIKNIYEPTGNTLSDMTAKYKDYFSTKLNKENYEKKLKELAEYAKLYKTKILSCGKGTEYSHEDTVKRLFLILQVNDISTFHAYILYLFYKHKDDEEILKEELLDLERYIVYNALTNASEKKKNYNKICVEFIKGTKNPKTELGQIKKDEIFKGLDGVSNKYATLWLFCIELYRRAKEGKHDLLALNYVYTLEHLMPQKWNQYWGNVKFVDDLGKEITDAAKGKANRDRKVYMLGNMTLLRSRLNSAIQNYPLQLKIKGDGRKKGIKDYVELTITRKDIVDNYSNGQVWNEKTILDRTNKLIDEILSCWGFNVI